MRNIPFKKIIIAVGIGLFISLVILAVLSFGIYLGKLPEFYPAAKGAIVLGAFLSAMLSASWAQKNKLLMALLSGAVFYLLLVLISALLNQPWNSVTAGFCLLLLTAGTLLGGACGALSNKKAKNKTKRRS